MSKDQAKEAKASKSKLRDVIETVIYLVIVVAVSLLIVKYVGQRTLVDGKSMYDTLDDRDNLIVDKISYRFRDPERFDIIVFPYQTGDNYIKRIIGMPGETVRIDETGKIFIDGEILFEDYGYETIRDPGRAIEEIVLADDEYFVMGDNRNNSKDSRNPLVGNIKRDKIIGRAILRIWPLNKFGKIDK